MEIRIRKRLIGGITPEVNRAAAELDGRPGERRFRADLPPDEVLVMLFK